jgi:hypothetical protein
MIDALVVQCRTVVVILFDRWLFDRRRAPAINRTLDNESPFLCRQRGPAVQ